MARLQAQARMEFYPTPEEEIIKAINKINCSAPVRMLDPCCGDGRTLKIFKEKLTADTYGIELDFDRAKQSKEYGNVLEADSLIEARVTPGAFNVVFNNPPYDEGNDYDSKRLENAFTEEYASSLCKGGLMLLVVPESILNLYHSLNRETKQAILSSFAVLSAYPLEADKSFKQWMLILRKLGRKHPLSVLDDDSDKDYYEESYADLIEISKRLNPTINHEDFNLSATPNNLTVFKSFRISREQYETASKQNDKTITRILDKLKPQDRVSSLLPLRKSHVALLLTTGALNGRIKGTPLIINGKIERAVINFEDTEIKEDKNGQPREMTVSKSINKFVAKVSVMRIDGNEPKIIELN